MELAGKAVGVLGGLFAAGDDAIHGFHVQGDNAWERTGNVLTMAGTVADLILGLEPIGLGLNLWAAADDFKGESDAETVQKQQNDATHKTLTTDPAPVHTWSQMGLVASVAPDAVHQNRMSQKSGVLAKLFNMRRVGMRLRQFQKFGQNT